VLYQARPAQRIEKSGDGFTYFSQAGPLGVRLPCNQMRQMRSSAMHYIAPGRYSYDLISVACRRSTRQK